MVKSSSYSYYKNAIRIANGPNNDDLYRLIIVTISHCCLYRLMQCTGKSLVSFLKTAFALSKHNCHSLHGKGALNLVLEYCLKVRERQEGNGFDFNVTTQTLEKSNEKNVYLLYYWLLLDYRLLH